MKTVAVYGSSMTVPGEVDYDASYALGKALAQAGYAVMTGGYAGVMGAVSKGASEVGGHVIGVTTTRIEEFRGFELRVNEWVVDEVRHATLRERVTHLVLEADAYVCMPGGLGTLHELSTVWELMRVNEIPERPLICYGNYWYEMLAPMRQNRYVQVNSWDLLKIADSPQDVVKILQEFKPKS